jgi:hypothetical protein
VITFKGESSIFMQGKVESIPQISEHLAYELRLQTSTNNIPKMISHLVFAFLMTLVRYDVYLLSFNASHMKSLLLPT